MTSGRSVPIAVTHAVLVSTRFTTDHPHQPIIGRSLVFWIRHSMKDEETPGSARGPALSTSGAGTGPVAAFLDQFEKDQKERAKTQNLRAAQRGRSSARGALAGSRRDLMNWDLGWFRQDFGPILRPTSLLSASGDVLFVASTEGRSPPTGAILGHPFSGPGTWTEIAPLTLPTVASMARGQNGSLLVTTASGLLRYRP
jgi:hypothetical protein